MTNRNKARGDQYERDVLKACRQSGFPWAERTRPGRREDEGDIHLAPGLIVQTKDAAQPRWREWLDQLAGQVRCARAEHGVLVVKRRGSGGRPPVHLAVMSLDEMLRLLCDAGWGDHDAKPDPREIPEPDIDTRHCFVCRRDLDLETAVDRRRRGCGPHCTEGDPN
ncbi:hypothetical protein [Gordonia iterans]